MVRGASDMEVNIIIAPDDSVEKQTATLSKCYLQTYWVVRGELVLKSITMLLNSWHSKANIWNTNRPDWCFGICYILFTYKFPVICRCDRVFTSLVDNKSRYWSFILFFELFFFFKDIPLNFTQVYQLSHMQAFFSSHFKSQHVKQRSQTGSSRSRDRICPRRAHSYLRQRPFVSVGMRPHTHIKVGMMSPALIVPLQCSN